MSSSMANAVKRKTHKERSQPAGRQKYGLLEKHKDYVERAKNFHAKEKAIKTLKRKAEERNPDEFYFAMESARTKNGVHDGRLTEANKYSQEQLALMKTQDVKYLSLKATSEANKAKRLKASLHFIGATGPTVVAAARPPQQQRDMPAPPALAVPEVVARRRKAGGGLSSSDKDAAAAAAAARAASGAAAGPRPRHVVFVDTQREARGFDASEYFGTPAELLDRTFNRPRLQQLASSGAVLGQANKQAEKRKYAAYKELSQRQERQAKVASVASHLSYQKEVMGKGRKRKLAGKELKAAAKQGADAPAGPVFVWKRERKK